MRFRLPLAAIVLAALAGLTVPVTADAAPQKSHQSETGALPDSDERTCIYIPLRGKVCW